MRIEDVIIEPGTRANQPAAATVAPGTLYCVSDESNLVERCSNDGLSWESYSITGPGTGDVIGPASSVDSEIALFSGAGGKTIKRASGTGLARVVSGVFSALTASAASRLLGRGSASGAGVFEEITLGSGLALTGTVLDVAAGAGFTLAIKTTSTIRTNNTLTADATLKITMLANTTYVFRIRMYVTGGTASDFRFRTNGPASPTRMTISRKSINPGGTSYTNAVEEAYSVSDVNITCTTGQDGYIEIDGVIENGVNAGDFAIDWAQITDSGGAENAIVYKGSYIEYKVVA